MNVLSALGSAITSSPEAGAVIFFMFGIILLYAIWSGVDQIIYLWKHRKDKMSDEKTVASPEKGGKNEG